MAHPKAAVRVIVNCEVWVSVVSDMAWVADDGGVPWISIIEDVIWAYMDVVWVYVFGSATLVIVKDVAWVLISSESVRVVISGGEKGHRHCDVSLT